MHGKAGPRLRHLGLAAALCAGVYFGHATFLTWCAAPLAPREAPARIDCLWVHTEWGLARVAEWYHAAPQRMLVMPQPRWSRLFARGVLPSYESLVRTKLSSYGVPAATLQVIPGCYESDWAEALGLGQWLQAYPQTQVLLVVDGFEGGAWRWTVHHALAPELAARVAVESVDLPGCSKNNWWKSRLGAKTFWAGWLYYLYAWRYGRLPPVGERWDPDAYERRLTASAKEASP